MATLYKADGTQEKVKPQNGKAFGIEEVQVMIGGYIKIVPLPESEGILVCNKDGKQFQLPINDKACKIACEILGKDYLRGSILHCFTEECAML